jgi:hypothetical protein
VDAGAAAGAEEIGLAAVLITELRVARPQNQLATRLSRRALPGPVFRPALCLSLHRECRGRLLA